MKLNKKGSSYIGLIVSIIVLLAIVSIVGTFMVYVSTHKQKVIEQNEFSHQISAQISEVYSEPWVDLEKETIDTKYGPIEVIEVLLTMAITISITYGVVILPTKLLQEYNEYNLLSVQTSDINLVRTSLTKDLSGVQAKEIDSSTLEIGDITYKFTEDGLKRDDNDSVIDLSSEVYFFELTENNLKVYNENVNMEYGLSTSLSRGEYKWIKGVLQQ